MLKLPINDLGNSLDKNWKTYVKLLQPGDELPLQDCRNLYLDFETTSQKPKEKSINPHKYCKILGVAFLFDQEPVPYYIPVRHCYLNQAGEYVPRPDIQNYPLERVHEWLMRVLTKETVWINQNVKYDMHVLLNEVKFYPPCQLLDTLTIAKLSEFQEQLNYSLDNIMKLFGIDITMYEAEIKKYLGRGIQDYGLIPPDKMAVYAGVDVLSCRYIHENIKIHKECSRVLELENQILPELIRMEQIGVRIDTQKLLDDYKKIIPQQEKRIKRIRRIMDFPDFEPGTKKHQEELFCNRLNWQIPLTDKSQEQFDKSGTEEGLAHSFAADHILRHASKHPRVAACWLKYQEDETLLNNNIIPYLEDFVNNIDVIHPSFIQIKRTGRMSCTQPNLMAVSMRAKEYIIPYTDDYVLVEFDLKQIEFRVIVHYIDNKKCISDFQNDPTTDFHTWVANLCGIDRYPAKRVNFMLGYGGGKEKTVALLASEPKIIGTLRTQEEIVARALSVYNRYHDMLPELKPTAWRASEVLRSRGHVRTLLNRHRNIPRQFHYKSFNSVCQGSAADFQKLLTLRLRKFISIDCLLHLLVHDSWIFSIKRNRVEELVPLIKGELERPIEEIEFSVPILSDCKISETNWRGCA